MVRLDRSGKDEGLVIQSNDDKRYSDDFVQYNAKIHVV